MGLRNARKIALTSGDPAATAMRIIQEDTQKLLRELIAEQKMANDLTRATNDLIRAQLGQACPPHLR